MVTRPGVLLSKPALRAAVASAISSSPPGLELSGKSENEIFEDLKGVIFLNPLYEYGNSYEPKYLMADEYLSGNVREKLRIAKNSAELYPEDYKVNVEALQKVQPKDLTAQLLHKCSCFRIVVRLFHIFAFGHRINRFKQLLLEAFCICICQNHIFHFVFFV